MMKAVAATNKPTITAVELAEKEQTTKSYKCYEVPLKPGTDTKQLLAELNEKKAETVERVAIVKREESAGHPMEATDASICTILWTVDSLNTEKYTKNEKTNFNSSFVYF